MTSRCRSPLASIWRWLPRDDRVPLALAGLFVRFYDPAAGRVLYDACDLRRAAIESVRRQIVLVTMADLVIPGTVTE